MFVSTYTHGSSTLGRTPGPRGEMHDSVEWTRLVPKRRECFPISDVDSREVEPRSPRKLRQAILLETHVVGRAQVVDAANLMALVQ